MEPTGGVNEASNDVQEERPSREVSFNTIIESSMHTCMVAKES